MDIVDVAHLTIAYTPTGAPAVDDVSFTVAAGEVLGILGGNGAGKTSTLRALAGVQAPTAGSLRVAGHDLRDLVDAEAGRALIGYCPDVAGLIRQATVREHVALALTFRDARPDWPAALDLVEKFGLTAVLDRATSGFSHGQSRRLSVLLAALTARNVLILDEPFDGVDPLGVAATLDVIAAAKDAGVAVVVSTHLHSLLTQVSDRVMVMVAGKVQDTAPVERYLGAVGQARYNALLANATAAAAAAPAAGAAR